jgi:hypothetical protein
VPPRAPPRTALVGTRGSNVTTVELPATVDQAVADLGGLGALLRAKEWHRAAIVAAFVRLDHGHGKRAETGTFHSATSFAALGITGLRKVHTVAEYVQRWLAEAGDYPEPGATVVLPEADWPPTRTGTDGHSSGDGVAATVARIVEREGGAEQLAEAVAAAPPAVRRAVRQATYDADLADHDTGARPTPPTPSRPNAAFDILRHSAAARAELNMAARLYDAQANDPDPGFRMDATGQSVLRRDLGELTAMTDLLLAVLDGAPADLSALFEADR